jgi:hypothetical protein
MRTITSKFRLVLAGSLAAVALAALAPAGASALNARPMASSTTPTYESQPTFFPAYGGPRTPAGTAEGQPEYRAVYGAPIPVASQPTPVENDFNRVTPALEEPAPAQEAVDAPQEEADAPQDIVDAPQEGDAPQDEADAPQPVEDELIGGGDEG